MISLFSGTSYKEKKFVWIINKINIVPYAIRESLNALWVWAHLSLYLFIQCISLCVHIQAYIYFQIWIFLLLIRRFLFFFCWSLYWEQGWVKPKGECMEEWVGWDHVHLLYETRVIWQLKVAEHCQMCSDLFICVLFQMPSQLCWYIVEKFSWCSCFLHKWKKTDINVYL